MSTFTSSFKVAVTPVRKPAGANRKALADLKRRVATLEKECRRLGGLLAKVPEPQAEPAEGQKARITGKGMRSLRRKLGLTQDEFGKLLGVSVQNVYQWERKNGPIRVRDATRTAILAVRDLCLGGEGADGRAEIAIEQGDLTGVPRVSGMAGSTREVWHRVLRLLSRGTKFQV